MAWFWGGEEPGCLETAPAERHFDFSSCLFTGKQLAQQLSRLPSTSWSKQQKGTRLTSYSNCCSWITVVPQQQECLTWQIWPLTNQELKPTASSKMMMSWLSSRPASKRKESESCESKKEPDVKGQQKSHGALQQWLQGATKKPRTKWTRTENLEDCLEVTCSSTLLL